MSNLARERRSLDSPTEQQLSMDRKKQRSLIVGLMYRVMRLGTAIFGVDHMMAFSLNGARMFHRFAFEFSSEIYGERFHNVSMGLSEEILRIHVPKNGSVLDVGCGYGRTCRLAARYADVVVGIDYDSDLLETARRQTSDKNIEYILGDATKGLDRRRFDLVLLIHVIEHIDDADGMLRGLTTVTDKMIVEVPDFESDPLNMIRFDRQLPFYSDADHVREYTESVLVDQLERNGWKVLETRKNGGAVMAIATAKN